MARVVGTAAGGQVAVSDSSVATASATSLFSAVLEGVNPGFDGDPSSPRSTNCGKCALAVFKRLNGDSSAIAGIGTISVSEMERATGRRQVPMSECNGDCGLLAEEGARRSLCSGNRSSARPRALVQRCV